MISWEWFGADTIDWVSLGFGFCVWFSILGCLGLGVKHQILKIII